MGVGRVIMLSKTFSFQHPFPAALGRSLRKTFYKYFSLLEKKRIFAGDFPCVAKTLCTGNDRVAATPLDRGARESEPGKPMNLPEPPPSAPEERKDCTSRTRTYNRLRMNPNTASTVPNAPAANASHWYALKVFYNKVQPLIAYCHGQGLEFFAPVEVIASLIFLHCNEESLKHFLADHPQGLYLYRQAGSSRPAVVPDREMEVFRFVVTAGHQGLELLGDDRPEYHTGDRVVVTDGPFKGAEGHIKRIKKDRRLVVTIPGVVAVATAYIHPSLLKKAEQ